MPAVDARPVAPATETPRQIFDAWVPWAILTVLILIWGFPQVQALLDKIFDLRFDMPWLHDLIRRMPPIELPGAAPIKAVFKFNLLSATGTGIFVASILIGWITGYSPAAWIRIYVETIWRIRLSLLTIAAMIALGNVTRYSGTDGTLGLALATRAPSIRFSARCWAGSGRRSPAPTPRPTFSSAVCRKSPHSKSASAPC